MSLPPATSAGYSTWSFKHGSRGLELNVPMLARQTLFFFFFELSPQILARVLGNAEIGLSEISSESAKC